MQTSKCSNNEWCLCTVCSHTRKRSNFVYTFVVIYPISLMIFVRLFIIMGASWFFEGISFLISPDNNTQFFTIFDIWNCLQGPIIFVSFIMRRRVLLLITKRSVDVGVFVTHIIHSTHNNHHMRVSFDCVISGIMNSVVKLGYRTTSYATILVLN